MSVTIGNDTLTGTAGNDVIDLLAGNDSYLGLDGNDAIQGSDGTDTIYGGNGDDSIAGGNGNDQIYGEAGNDSIDAGAGTFDIIRYNQTGGEAITATINAVGGSSGYNAATVTTVSQGNDTIANFEFINSSLNNDSFIVNGAATASTLLYLFGGTGNDTITMNIASNSVMADYNASSGNAGFTRGVSVDLAAGYATDYAGTDQLINVRGVNGSSLNDTILGSANDDRFREQGGSDSIDGRGGSDMLDYSGNGSSQSVSANLATGFANDGRGGADTLISIEQVRGGTGNDVLIGDGNINIFRGNGGSDTIDGAGGTADAADYATATAAVSVNLATGQAQDGQGGVDSLTGIEYVYGSAYGDTLISGNGDDSLRGNAGNDFLDGGNGNDTLSGSGPDDTLFGGAGNDLYLIAGINNGMLTDSSGSDTVSMLGGGVDTTSASAGDLDGGLGIEAIDLAGTSHLLGLTAAAVISVSGTDMLRIYGSGNDSLVFEDTGWVRTGSSGGFDTLSNSGGNATVIAATELVSSDMGSVVNGGDGNDTLGGGNGADTIDGGNGSDIITGFAGNDTILGGNSDDSVDGGDGADSVLGDLGNDRLQGANGNDSLSGGDANDILYGGNDADTLSGGAGTDYIYGDSGNDYLVGGLGSDIFAGGDGIDIVDFSGGTGGVIVNLLTISGPAFVTDGLGSFDAVSGVEGAIGSAFVDYLYGTNSDDIFVGGGGDDVMLAWSGNDSLDGGADNDVLLGNAGRDTLIGADGDDYLWAGDGDDTLAGGNGIDVLVGDLAGLGETGSDTMVGGDGADILLGGAGDDSLMSGSGTGGGAAPSDPEWFVGGAGNDTYIGASGRDVIWEQLDLGEGGNDLAQGGDGNDLILTGIGNDTLVGGNGNDDLYGGSGTDAFVFGANWGSDVVWDWVNGERFDLRGSGATSFSQLTIGEGYGGSVNITFGSNSILVLGASGLIDSADFLL